MPDKDPSFWVLVLLALKENGLAMVIAFVLAWLRIQYDAKEASVWRKLIEASIGSIVVMVVGLTVKEFGFSLGWAFATAGFVGILGVEQLRQLGKRWAERKVDSV
ncbi:phage holin family protein [Pseudomonas mandelii]|uniref:phage holin family protein n=1 Tax=Pseudomonas mandelii TaxID=75612 RepID=UPI001E560332|nr:phage holin family protein [Pseudomonas mandelii]